MDTTLEVDQHRDARSRVRRGAGSRRLFVVVAVAALACVFAAPAATARDDYGGGPATWSTTPVEPRDRTPDGCAREEFAVTIEVPVLVVDAPDYRYAGPLLLAGAGGSWPCWWWHNTAGWLEVRAANMDCRFIGSWHRPSIGEQKALLVSLYGWCGDKQLDLFASLAVTGPRRADGPLIVTNCQ